MTPLISVEELTIEFKTPKGYFIAVDNASYDVAKGETLGIVGESGSGKTVSSLALMGLLQKPPAKITSGKILYRDENEAAIDLLCLEEQRIQKLRGKVFSMIFQEPMTSLNPIMKCGEQLAEVFKIHQRISDDTIKKEVLNLFEEVELPEPKRIYNAYPHELSGGQKQRVMIAMAISQKPKLLIADEPTTALDVTVQKKILTLLKSLVEKYNMAMIFISHDLGVISEVAHRVCVMYKGKIVENDVANIILTKPTHPYTQGLIACRPPINSRPAKLLTISDFMNNEKSLDSIPLVSQHEINKKHEILYAQPPILEVNNLTVEFKTRKTSSFKKTLGFKALTNISFSVWEGETLGLVGESGCGKTTLGRTILQLIKQSDGNISYKGKELTTLKSNEIKRLRKKLQIIFQDPYSSLNPRITIEDAMLEPMIVHKLYSGSEERMKKCIYLLNRVGLEKDALRKYPHEFSGGQRQRICIARALALEPELIVCDESVSALDVSVQAQVLNLLNELKLEMKLTYIFISHDLSVVRYMSDRLIVMNKGEIVESDNADNLYSNPKSEYTKKLLDAIPVINFDK